MSLGIPIDAQVWIVDSGVDVATTVRELVADAHARGVAEANARWEKACDDEERAVFAYIPHRTIGSIRERMKAGPAPGDVKR